MKFVSGSLEKMVWQSGNSLFYEFNWNNAFSGLECIQPTNDETFDRFVGKKDYPFRWIAFTDPNIRA